VKGTPVVFFHRKTKRLLVELDRYVFSDSALVAYEFFLTDSVNTIGFKHTVKLLFMMFKYINISAYEKLVEKS
jgi:hypothetical protein